MSMPDLPYPNLFFQRRDGWTFPFAFMVLMAAGIASMGLSEDSAATVIGAMIVAPLGQPILALGAAVALRRQGEAAALLSIVVVGAALVVAFGFLANLALPTQTPNGQILARTAPDFRDLAIAIFAGAAGAYGYRNENLSGVLAGVAIAVALVPPLCVVGMMLEEGRTVLAFNAFVLFATNFAGITLSAMLVFALGALKDGIGRNAPLIAMAAMVVAVNAIILVPLSFNYERVLSPSINRAETYAAVDAALQGAFARSTLRSLTVNGSELALVVDPLPTDPAAVDAFAKRVEAATGYQVVVTGPS